mmetsp:Transcript_9771/g.59399  ORF Transcript_9771/g.59399 Transcript_9771/m.59399 type:complete len:301 (+) Transcript_9771:2116-3018(+)
MFQLSVRSCLDPFTFQCFPKRRIWLDATRFHPFASLQDHVRERSVAVGAIGAERESLRLCAFHALRDATPPRSALQRALSFVCARRKHVSVSTCEYPRPRMQHCVESGRVSFLQEHHHVLGVLPERVDTCVDVCDVFRRSECAHHHVERTLHACPRLEPSHREILLVATTQELVAEARHGFVRLHGDGATHRRPRFDDGQETFADFGDVAEHVLRLPMRLAPLDLLQRTPGRSVGQRSARRGVCDGCVVLGTRDDVLGMHVSTHTSTVPRAQCCSCSRVPRRRHPCQSQVATRGAPDRCT